MAILKTQRWLPDTHPGHVIEIEWEYDPEAGRDTGREHRGVSVRYPDGTLIHSQTHGPDVAHQHYQKLLAEHIGKNQAYAIIVASLPAHMKKPLQHAEISAVLGGDSEPMLVLKDFYRPRFTHLGNGRYEFAVPEIDEETHQKITIQLAQFNERVVLLKSVQEERT